MVIFKNEQILSPDYLPDMLPHREGQIKQLADNISNKRRPQNTFLFGAPGIGKTASVRYVFREFEGYSGVKTIYINCWDFNTPTAVLAEIINSIGLMGVIVQRRGWGKDEIMQRFNEAMNKIGKNVVICMDEVDQLIFKDQSVLYDLLRANTKNTLGIVFISNNPHVFAKLEPRIASSLSVDEVEFKPYTLAEMKDILQERVRNALGDVELGVVAIAANHAVQKGGDVRIGLSVLTKAAMIAEKEGNRKLTVEHVKKVLTSIMPVKPQLLKEKINHTEKIIVELLDKQQMKSNDLYDAYCRIAYDPISDRAFRDCITHLQQLSLISITENVEGKTRLIFKV